MTTPEFQLAFKALGAGDAEIELPRLRAQVQEQLQAISDLRHSKAHYKASLAAHQTEKDKLSAECAQLKQQRQRDSQTISLRNDAIPCLSALTSTNSAYQIPT